MNNLAPIVCLIFVVLACWHFYMACLPRSSESGALPSADGKALFVPSAQATVAVGIVLLLCAGLVAATAGILPLRMSPIVLSWFSYALALGLLVRAVGEFKYLGFFKRVRGSRFATLDTFVYSPLCLLLAVGVGLVARTSGV